MHAALLLRVLSPTRLFLGCWLGVIVISHFSNTRIFIPEFVVSNARIFFLHFFGWTSFEVEFTCGGWGWFFEDLGAAGSGEWG